MAARTPFCGQGHVCTGGGPTSFMEQGAPEFPVLLSHLGGTDWGLTAFFLPHF